VCNVHQQMQSGVRISGNQSESRKKKLRTGKDDLSANDTSTKNDGDDGTKIEKKASGKWIGREDYSEEDAADVTGNY
jgi:predicted phage gp36 major capsid-like protein